MSLLQPDFVAHSYDGKAVRQVRAFDRNCLTAALLFIGACLTYAAASYMSTRAFSTSLVHTMFIAALALAGLFVLMLVLVVWSRYTMSTYVKRGTILVIDRSTRRDYRAIIRETNTNWSADALFDRQQAMNVARKAQDVLYREEWKRTAPTADKPVGDKKVGA